jgi:hypothetical protein
MHELRVVPSALILSRNVSPCVAHHHGLHSGTRPRRLRHQPAKSAGLVKASVCRRRQTATNDTLREIERRIEG